MLMFGAYYLMPQARSQQPLICMAPHIPKQSFNIYLKGSPYKHGTLNGLSVHF